MILSILGIVFFKFLTQLLFICAFTFQLSFCTKRSSTGRVSRCAARNHCEASGTSGCCGDAESGDGGSLRGEPLPNDDDDAEGDNEGEDAVVVLLLRSASAALRFEPRGVDIKFHHGIAQ